MVERHIIAQIDNGSRSSLREGISQEEQLPRSSEHILITGMIDGEEKGKLNASLVVRRIFDEETGDYVESTRVINLGSIEVRPKYRHQGLGTAMLAEIERQARLFGAERISGKVTDTDVRETPNLLGFYRGNGFTPNKVCEGWVITKPLSSRALH